jgi:hypothetical protein
MLVCFARSVVILDGGKLTLRLTESMMKAGQGKGGARRPASKFPGLVKKLEQAAAQKSAQERPAYPGQIILKTKRP